jgi:hypothetical protein
MNELNNATLKACQRLVDAGIVLETDLYWRVVPSVPCIPEGCIELVTIHQMRFLAIGDDDRDGRDIDGVIYLPAPSLAEVWRELPYCTNLFKSRTGDSVVDLTTVCGSEYRSINPTDALIDLLIFVTEQKRKDKP